MSAYSKDPSGANPELEPVTPRPIVAMGPEAPIATPTEIPARRPFRSAFGGAPSLLLEMAQVADYCRGLEKSAHDEQRRADEVRTRVEEERAKFHQALLNAKLETRRYGAQLKKAATEFQSLVARSSQSASQLEEMTRREAAARLAHDAARAELTTYRARSDAEREAMGNRIREGEKDYRAATERFAKREMQLEENARALEVKIKEQEAAAELARLELTATQGRVQAVTRQLERHQAALRDFAELQNRYKALEQRCRAFESTLAEGKSKYRALVDRLGAAKQRNDALEQELARLREANRVLSEKKSAAPIMSAPPPRAPASESAAASSALASASDSAAARKANAELRQQNEELTAELARVRKTVPLIELLRLKEGELERLAGELAKTPEQDATRRGAIITRRDAVTLQRDQLSVMLKRFEAKPQS